MLTSLFPTSPSLSLSLFVSPFSVFVCLSSCLFFFLRGCSVVSCITVVKLSTEWNCLVVWVMSSEERGEQHWWSHSEGRGIWAPFPLVPAARCFESACTQTGCQGSNMAIYCFSVNFHVVIFLYCSIYNHAKWRLKKNKFFLAGLFGLSIEHLDDWEKDMWSSTGKANDSSVR